MRSNTTNHRRRQVMEKHIKVLALFVVIAITATATFGKRGNGNGNGNTGLVTVTDTDNPARQPWAAQANIQIPPSAAATSYSVQFFVPPAKRLVIESYSGGDCTTPQGPIVSGGLEVVTNGGSHTHLL